MNEHYVLEAEGFSQRFDDIHEAIQYGFDNLNGHGEWTLKRIEDGALLAHAVVADKTIYVQDTIDMP